MSHPKWHGPFHVTALSGTRELGDGLFDSAFEARNARDTEIWGSFEADLPEGEVTLRLSKHENKNASGIARNVDCLLLTMDMKLVPNHLHYGAQTFVRVTSVRIRKPIYIHIFVDHFHAPWYHFSPPRGRPDRGEEAGCSRAANAPWCNITPLIFQDSGAMLHHRAPHLHEYAGHCGRSRLPRRPMRNPSSARWNRQPAGRRGRLCSTEPAHAGNVACSRPTRNRQETGNC
jgi:hypothetical protein